MTEEPRIVVPLRKLEAHPYEGVMALWTRFHQNAPARARPSLLRRVAAYRVVCYFLLGLAALDGFLHYRRDIWSAYDPDDYRERLDGCRARPADLVLIGGSPVSEGVDPNVLTGLTWRGRPLERAYNLGLPGATTSEVWHAVEHGLAAPPRLLVYGISASDLNDSRFEPNGPRTLMDLGDLAEWVRLRPDAAEWVVRHYVEERVGGCWQLFYYRNAVRLWAADQADQLWPDAFPRAVAEARAHLQYTADLRRGNGFAPERKLRLSRLDHLRIAGQVSKRFHHLEKYQLGGHLLYLDKILDWGQANGVPVVLVDMPVSAQLEEQMHPQAFAMYRARLKEVTQQRMVPILWASRTTVGVGDGDFADLIHLNAQGTAKLSGWLRQALAAAPE